MFKIQKKVLYAIEAVIDIAINSGTEPVQNIAIARRQGIPKRYLEQTLQSLVKKNILVGSRGPKGGYRLAKERRKIKLSDIIHSVSDEKNLSQEMTSEIAQKIVNPLLKEMTTKCEDFLGNITVNTICETAKKKKIQKLINKKADFVI